MDTITKPIDDLILGILKNEPQCSLTYLSSRLKLPKTQIIKRINYLCDNELLYFRENGFYTTYEGNCLAIYPNDITFSNDKISKNDNPEFSWEECIYIPSPEMFKRKK